MEKIKKAVGTGNELQIFKQFYDHFYQDNAEHMTPLQVSELLSIKEKMKDETAGLLEIILKSVPKDLMEEAEKLTKKDEPGEELTPAQSRARSRDEMLGELGKARKKLEIQKILENIEGPVETKSKLLELVKSFLNFAEKNPEHVTAEHIARAWDKVIQLDFSEKFSERLNELGMAEKFKKAMTIYEDKKE